jgi:hypothetical protein
MTRASPLRFSIRKLLFCRRQIWLPTLWGALLIGGVLAAIGLGLGRNAYALLAPQQPAPGARTLIVEGWLNRAELQQAAAVVRTGRYERVVATGGPIDPEVDAGQWRNHAQRTAAHLREFIDGTLPVIAIETPASAQERTYLSAVMVRRWAQQNGTRLGTVDLFSVGVHARRSWLLYRMALGPEVEVGVLAARPAGFDAERWWTNSMGAKSTLGEALSLGWTRCCFWPGAPGSHDELWGVPAAPK